MHSLSDALILISDDDVHKENDQQSPVQDIVYYSSSSKVQSVTKRTNTDIPMKDFENVYNSMLSDGGNKFAEQFNVRRLELEGSLIYSPVYPDQFSDLMPSRNRTRMDVHF